ncbi:MAG: hypothetical protein ACYCV7_05300 [Acidimicrobiales bacterium]
MMAPRWTVDRVPATRIGTPAPGAPSVAIPTRILRRPANRHMLM